MHSPHLTNHDSTLHDSTPSVCSASSVVVHPDRPACGTRRQCTNPNPLPKHPSCESCHLVNPVKNNRTPHPSILVRPGHRLTNHDSTPHDFTLSVSSASSVVVHPDRLKRRRQCTNPNPLPKHPSCESCHLVNPVKNNRTPHPSILVRPANRLTNHDSTLHDFTPSVSSDSPAH